MIFQKKKSKKRTEKTWIKENTKQQYNISNDKIYKKQRNWNKTHTNKHTKKEKKKKFFKYIITSMLSRNLLPDSSLPSPQN